jgi:two-component system response regulator ResD
MYYRPCSLAERGRQPGGLHDLRSSSSAGSILYVEDDEDTRELVTYLLGRSNYKVFPAENYGDALRLARANQFDLYLVDNWISGGSGIDLCKKLREFNLLTPILFYSGAAYERDRQQAFDAGAQGYLVKPVDNDELIEEVSRIISAAKRRPPPCG